MMSHSDSTPTGMQLQLYPVIKSIEVVLRNFIGSPACKLLLSRKLFSSFHFCVLWVLLLVGIMRDHSKKLFQYWVGDGGRQSRISR